MAIYWKNSSLPFRTRNWQIYKSPKELCFLISPYGAASCMHKQRSASPFLLYMAYMIWGRILSLSLYLTLSVSLSLLSLHCSPPFSQSMSCCLFVFPLNLSRYLVFLSCRETIYFLSGTLFYDQEHLLLSSSLGSFSKPNFPYLVDLIRWCMLAHFSLDHGRCTVNI